MTQQIIFNVTYHIVYLCVIVTFVMSVTFATGSDGARAQGKEGLASARHTGQNQFFLYFWREQWSPRLEICRDRRDRRSCKIFVRCVIFSRKQRSSYIFCKFTHT